MLNTQYLGSFTHFYRSNLPPQGTSTELRTHPSTSNGSSVDWTDGLCQTSMTQGCRNGGAPELLGWICYHGCFLPTGDGCFMLFPSASTHSLHRKIRVWGKNISNMIAISILIFIYLKHIISVCLKRIATALDAQFAHQLLPGPLAELPAHLDQSWLLTQLPNFVVSIVSEANMTMSCLLTQPVLVFPGGFHSFAQQDQQS